MLLKRNLNQTIRVGFVIVKDGNAEKKDQEDMNQTKLNKHLTSLTVGLMLVSTSLVVFMDSDEVFAIHEQNQVSVFVKPDFPDPRLMEIPQLGYENGMLTVTKLNPNSRLDLIFEGKEIINDSMKTSFVINKLGCYLVEEEGQFSATDSNKVCKNVDGTITIQGYPHENYVEKRDFFNIDNKDEIITLTKLNPNSRLDLIFEGKEIVNDSMKTSFVINKLGCYLVEEGQFSAPDSNKVCKNADGTITIQGYPHENYVEKRDFFNIDNKDGIITLIVLPTQKDLKFLSACPQNYSELLQACYRNVDDKQFIITSWETISHSIIKHELKHADCDCDFHFVNMHKKLERSGEIDS